MKQCFSLTPSKYFETITVIAIMNIITNRKKKDTNYYSFLMANFKVSVFPVKFVIVLILKKENTHFITHGHKTYYTV